MQPLRDAIKKKYGVSDEVSNQVIKALTEVEKHRQDAAGDQVHGFRARQPGEQSAGRTQQVPDIGTIIGQATNSPSRQTSVSAQGSGLIGIIISVVMMIIQMVMGRKDQSQGSSTSSPVTSILTDLLGGATQPGQAPDLASILGGLLESGTSGPATQSGNQSFDIQEIMEGMLGNQASSSTGRTRPKSR